MINKASIPPQTVWMNFPPYHILNLSSYAFSSSRALCPERREKDTIEARNEIADKVIHFKFLMDPIVPCLMMIVAMADKIIATFEPIPVNKQKEVAARSNFEISRWCLLKPGGVGALGATAVVILLQWIIFGG